MDLVGKHDSHACSHCGNPAKMICVGCKGMPDGSQGQMEVRYCGTKCQKEDWTSHKTLCSAARARKAIYRAGELAKVVSHLFTRTKYKMVIKEVKKFGNVWIIYPPSEYKGSKCALHPFPSALFANKQDADAILEFQSCNAVLDHLHGFLKDLLTGQLHLFTVNETLRLANDITGLCAEVDEVIHFTKNVRVRLIQAYNTGLTSNPSAVDATDYLHSVIRITSKNGDKYVMDLTGAQYAWQEIVTPYDIYQQSKIRLIQQVLPFGGTRQLCKERAENTGGIAQWHHRADIGFETALNDLLRFWQQGNMSLSTLLRLPDDQFEKQQAGLLEMLEAGLQTYRKFMTETGAFDLKGDIIIGGFDRKFKDVTGKAIN